VIAHSLAIVARYAQDVVHVTDKTSTEQRLPDFGWQCLAAGVLAFLATSPMKAKFCLWLERVMTNVFLISVVFLTAGVMQP